MFLILSKSALILKIMEELSYIPNRMAQSLAGSPSHSIGIVIDELANLFFVEIADGLDDILSRAGFSMQISSSRWNEEREFKHVQHLISSRVDGIILAPVSGESDILTYEQGYEIAPLLSVRNHINQIPTAIYVNNDNVAMGLIARLIELNISIPDQVAVIGYDNTKLSVLCRIPLTTVSQEIKNMGKIAAMDILEMIKNPIHGLPQHLIEPRLIIRESAILPMQS